MIIIKILILCLMSFIGGYVDAMCRANGIECASYAIFLLIGFSFCKILSL